ncbi:MAG: hypothetical protein BMS9Abin17_0052 [Acidimicrobiia bacterium]|nr:MAG: hypothetical protein BMS9Abin17_0052 [Acidimicrobiia bacterium]
MRIDGRVWFDFTNPEVWHFYRFVRAFVEAGNHAAIEWLPLYNDSEVEAMSAFVMPRNSEDRGRFLHAMLGLVHMEHLDANKEATVVNALESAGLASEIVIDVPQLQQLAKDAHDLGVQRTPTIYNHGPVMHVTLNGAATAGDVEETGRTLMDVLGNDGIWAIEKP